MANDIFTLDDDNNAAIRTVNRNAGESVTNDKDIFTVDEDGNAAVRVVGGGGGGSSLPDQTGHAGEFLITNGTDASWSKLSQVVTVSESTLTQELANNTIYNAGELSSLIITFPATPTADYISQVNFTSGATPTALTAPVGTVWRGSDVSTVFVPAANTRYSVLFYYDGVNMRGLVQGV